MTKKQTTKKENYEKEEWGGWKIVSDMLDHPDKNRTYQTSECYQKLYDFVMAQKRRARQKERKRVKEMIKEIWFREDLTPSRVVGIIIEKINKEK